MSRQCPDCGLTSTPEPLQDPPPTCPPPWSVLHSQRLTPSPHIRLRTLTAPISLSREAEVLSSRPAGPHLAYPLSPDTFPPPTHQSPFLHSFSSRWASPFLTCSLHHRAFAPAVPLPSTVSSRATLCVSQPKCHLLGGCAQGTAPRGWVPAAPSLPCRGCTFLFT